MGTAWNTQKVLGAYPDILVVTSGSTEYNFLQGGAAWTTGENWRAQLMPCGGTFSNMMVRRSNAAGTTVTYTLRVNNADSALTTSFSSATVEGTDTTNEVHVDKGDKVCISGGYTGGDGTTSTADRWSFDFTPDEPGETWIGHGNGDWLINTGPEYMRPMSGYSSWGNITGKSMTMPTDGTITNYMHEIDRSPGADPNEFEFSIYINEVQSDATVTITSSNYTDYVEWTGTLDVVQGDLICIGYIPTSSPTVPNLTWWGFIFVPDVIGETIQMGVTTNDLSTTATERNALTGSMNWSTGTDVLMYPTTTDSKDTVLTKLSVNLINGAPGAGADYTFTIQALYSDKVTVVISDTDTYGYSNDGTYVIDGWHDYCSIVSTPSVGPAPAVSDASWGCVIYVEPWDNPVIVDFEENDYTDVSGHGVSGTGTESIASDSTMEETYNYKAKGYDTSNRARCWILEEDINSHPRGYLYARGLFRTDVVPTVTNDDITFIELYNSNGTFTHNLRIYKYSDAIYLNLWDGINTVGRKSSAISVPIVADTTYDYQMEVYSHDSAGYIKVWWEDELVIDVSAIDTKLTYPTCRFYFGSFVTKVDAYTEHDYVQVSYYEMPGPYIELLTGTGEFVAQHYLKFQS